MTDVRVKYGVLYDYQRWPDEVPVVRLEQHQAALAAKDQQVAAWQMAYEGVQRQLAEKDQELAQLKAYAIRADEMRGKALVDLSIMQNERDAAESHIARITQLSDSEMIGLLRRRARYCEMLEKEHADLKYKLDTLLAEAVWAMKEVADMYSIGSPVDGEELLRAQAFFARPDVQAWQARQKESSTRRSG